MRGGSGYQNTITIIGVFFNINNKLLVILTYTCNDKYTALMSATSHNPNNAKRETMSSYGQIDIRTKARNIWFHLSQITSNNKLAQCQEAYS